MKSLVFFIALSPMIFCPVFHSFGDQTDSVAQKGIYHFILLLFWAQWFTTCGGSSRLNAKRAIYFLFFFSPPIGALGLVHGAEVW